MKVASFNVNSVRVRLNILLDWLSEHKPDILFLQEIKCLTENFPKEDFEKIGYNCHVIGQKSYNGVACLSLEPLTLAKTSFDPDLLDDPNARIIEVIGKDNTRYIGIYAPNGNPIDSEKFDYKMSWLRALEGRVEQLLSQQESFLITGDFNIIPNDFDVFSVDYVKNDATYSQQAKDSYQRLLNSMMCDAWRYKNPTTRGYSYWDFFRNNFQQDNGMRIDHVLLSPRLADRLIDCYIDPVPRGLDRPSDHTPIIVHLS